MPDNRRGMLNREKLLRMKPKAITLSQKRLIETSYLDAGLSFPLVMEPSADDLDLKLWAESNMEFLQAELLKHGAILFRGFPMISVAEFAGFVSGVCGELIDYSEPSTPRTEVGGKVYTSTEYPATETIPLHNEMSYAGAWPMKICFFCLLPAAQGGETPIADSRKVLQYLPAGIKAEFIRKNLMYIRTYGGRMGLSWQSVFGTDNKAQVEDRCRAAQIDFQWLDEDRLRTRHLRRAVAAHPATGETVWFNQAHVHHLSGLEPGVRSILSAYGEEALPFNTVYGDGSSIEASVLDEVREAYRKAMVAFPWQKGDVLLLDNMLAAHGRASFTGPRQIVVAMAEAFSSQAS